MMSSRRIFLAQTGLTAAALLTLPALKGLAAKPVGKGRCGLQLYSLRDQLPKDPQGWIKKVAEAGYQNCETFAPGPDNKFFGMAVKDFKALLDANNLTTTSGHYGMDEYLGKGTDQDLGRYIDIVHALGQRYMTVPWLAEAFRKDWAQIADKFNALAARLKKEGIRMAYHNHNFEFEKAGATNGLEILLKHTDPDLVHFEMDLYWVVRGGADPVALFREHPGRFVMWHIKDMDRTTPTLNTEVGAGSIDFVKIFQYHKLAGLEESFMEQENYAAGMDPYTSIAQSASYIKNKLLV
jgi:sugar phosphate isomerase/epimerase